MNNDFVRRDDILELKRTLYRVRCGTDYQSIEDTEAVEVDDIESVPAVDVQPVKRGKWIEVGTNQPLSCDTLYGCSRCQTGRRLKSELTNYCPNCGADMRGVNNDY